MHPGIIPARAGFTPMAPCRATPSPDHPRSRGVYLAVERGITIPARIIPARAGFTPRPCDPARTGRDHPRSRGVYPMRTMSPQSTSGSSPLARGLRSSTGATRSCTWIIPARAGFTLLVLGRASIRTDHPRSRGVYPPSRSPRWSASGSSPLARGLHDAAVRKALRARIIPARAGFTTGHCPRTPGRPDHPRSRGVYVSHM